MKRRKGDGRGVTEKGREKLWDGRGQKERELGGEGGEKVSEGRGKKERRGWGEREERKYGKVREVEFVNMLYILWKSK